MRFRTFFPAILLWSLLVVPLPVSAVNTPLDFRTGMTNFIKVTDFIQKKFDQETDQAILYEKAWVCMKKVLPASDVIPSGTVVSSSSKEIRDFYAHRIEETLKQIAYTQPDDATPTVLQLWNEATRGLVWALKDPYSQFLPAEEHRELQRALSGEPDEEKQFYGVGISVDWDTQTDAGVLVVSPLPGTPAERSGIRAGDVIVEVNGEPLNNWDGTTSDKLEKAINRIKGEKGSEVKLTIRRSGAPEPLEFVLTREPINPELHISKEMLDDEVGYIHLYSFYAHAVDDVLQSLRYLKMAGMKKLILDMRLNPGGYLDQAVNIADLFLENGDLITFTKGRNSTPRHFYKRGYTGSDYFADIPMVILINEYSASASEVVTGALKDNGRALVIGKKSFGKGSVQEVFGLDGGAGLRLTVAKYYTPSGVCIHEKGIQPDIEVDRLTEEEWDSIKDKEYHSVSRLNRITERDPQLKVALQYLRGEITLADSNQPENTEK
ncbi:MAG: S41 family peptidase [Candidatus Omnitrophica bacterium]|nr:S41 family peptidase [Candidatus Omnitrophota bacterium]